MVEKKERPKTKSSTRTDQVLEFLSSGKPHTHHDIALHFGIAMPAIYQAIKKLLDEHKIIRTRPPKSRQRNLIVPSELGFIVLRSRRLTQSPTLPPSE